MSEELAFIHAVRENHPDWMRHLSTMQRLERAMPADVCLAVGAVQCLADLLIDLAPRLADAELAQLYATGAMLVRFGNAEFKAEFAFLFDKPQPGAPA